ncbi:unnamed protein product [Dibothriocephalus latus]|uniref:Uncharacterized protein n=1 Tax=Dibothriocephalus latus TaxID=60516 RepID=A0A3P6QEN7_DIBLA|nr:unnamed protein product [Dibothriocephalus latus]
MSDKVNGMDLTPPDSSTPKTSPNDQRESQEVAKTPTSSIDEDSSVEEKKPSPSSDKKVHFPQDGKLVHSVFEGGEAWRLDPSVPNEEVIDRYAAHAYSLDRKPISSIIEQLSKMTIPFALCAFAAFVFKGTQLALPDIEALEEIFKYCHATHLSFENTNLERKVYFYLEFSVTGVIASFP